MERSSLMMLLKVNGLSADSPKEDILNALKASGYTESEYEGALALLFDTGQPLQVTSSHVVRGAYLSSVLERTKSPMIAAPILLPFSGRIGVAQFWSATGLLTLIYALLFAIIQVTATPLFSIAGGVSFRSVPDLAVAPMETLLLLAVGAALIVMPLIFFAVLGIGLQVRRFHDYGLSGVVWFGISIAEIVLLVVAYGNPLYFLTAVALLALLNIGLLSWPSAEEENVYGEPVDYVSPCAGLLGSTYEEGNLQKLITRFILPVIYIEVLGVLFAYGVHRILPQVSLPSFAPTQAESAEPKMMEEELPVDMEALVY